MDVVNAWCKGGSFSSIVELTDVYEGSIIRAMRRLEELLRDMCHAAKGSFTKIKVFLYFLGELVWMRDSYDSFPYPISHFYKRLIAIGNAELESKFAKGIELIKRDIVFAASLYL